MNNQEILTQELIKASEDYYNRGLSTMSDIEFDQKVEELRKLEAESGVILPGSPTQKVGARVEGLKIVRHEYPALSLGKVKYKDREDLINWLGHKAGIMSWKLDGSTIVLTYDDGKLTSAVTRGQDGIEGGDITHNARYFKGVPTSISYKGHLIVRGEAMMSNAEFERLNEEAGGKYENARNLGTATVQMLDPEESRKREIIFKAFKLVYPIAEEGLMLEAPKNADKSLYDGQMEYERFDWLKALGFGVVDYAFVSSSDILERIDYAEEKLSKLDYPTDGLVISYVDQVYADGLGMTGHHPRGSIAMKWSDETKETTIREIEWSVGKTGIITPVAVFDPVRLGLGSNVSRASLHNISIMKHVPAADGNGTYLCGRGSKVNVYLANMIIPQIASCTPLEEDFYPLGLKKTYIPKRCPICGEPTRIENNNGIEVLHCDNSMCDARVEGLLENTFSKAGLFVNGLGPAQIKDLINKGLINRYPETVFRLKKNIEENEQMRQAKEELLSVDGWGKRSWNNLLKAIDAARETDLQHFLYALNIPLLGKDLSKKLAKHWNNDIDNFRSFVLSKPDPMMDELTALEGVGEEKARNIIEWCMEVTANNEEYFSLEALIYELNFKAVEVSNDNSLEGMTFVITGSVNVYKNRDEFKASVEARGGKVSGSVSSKTNFLVNNDTESTSSKNKKAQSLNIPIISEAEFIERFGK